MKAVNLDLLLPADLPAGETIVWHGRPDAVSLTRHALRADVIAAWFAVMVIWNVASAAEAGAGAALVSGAKTIGAAVLALALVSLIGWLTARSTLYVITSRRIVMKIGIALPVFFNLPFSTITSAALLARRDGTGDIPLALQPGQHIAYLHLWPHARPFRLTRPEPALRCIPRAGEVAEKLSRALIAASGQATGQEMAGAVQRQTQRFVGKAAAA